MLFDGLSPPAFLQDYKHGWQLDKDWEEKQKAHRERLAKLERGELEEVRPVIVPARQATLTDRFRDPSRRIGELTPAAPFAGAAA